MGTSCTKVQHPAEENVVRRKDFANFRQFLLAKLRIRRRVQNQPGPINNVNDDEEETEVRPFSPMSDTSIASQVQAIESMSVSSSLINDQQELELIDLENEDQPVERKPTVVVSNRKRRARPYAAFGERPLGPMLPLCVEELNNDIQGLISEGSSSNSGVTPPAKSSTLLDNRHDPANDVVHILPGEVIPSGNTGVRKAQQIVSRPQLTVPGIRTMDQRKLDVWMRRQALAEIARDCDAQ